MGGGRVRVGGWGCGWLGRGEGGCVCVCTYYRAISQLHTVACPTLASIQDLSKGVDLWPKLSNPEVSREKHT